MSIKKVSELTSGSFIGENDILYMSQNEGEELVSKQITLDDIQRSFAYSVVKQDVNVYYNDTYNIGNSSGGTFNSLYLGSGELGLGGQSGSTLYYHTDFGGTATEKDLITNTLHIAQYVGSQGQNTSGITIDHTTFGYNNTISETLRIDDLQNTGRTIYLFEQVVPLMGGNNTILARNSDEVADFSWNTPQEVGLATTGSNNFIGNQTITGSVNITGSLIVTGSILINNNLEISGTTTLGGNIVPKTPRGATLGTLSNPFADIFVSSGSINIAGIPGQPNTTLSNISGAILISAGNMQLVGSASFIAQTGSFQYISGSMKQVGNYTQEGNYSILGNKSITGSLNITGSGFINTHRILTDLDSGSFAITGSNVFTSGQTITGSVNITGSLIVTGSLIMGGTAQTYFSHTVTNPSNYVLHQFLTSSYHGGTYAFSAHDNSTNKVTVYSNYIVAQGANAITSNIGGDSKLSSGAGAPNPTFAVGFSGSYAQFKVTDTGTFTYKGIVQIY